MLDIQFIRDHPDIVREKSAQKGYQVDIDGLLKADELRRNQLHQVEELQKKRNEHAASFKDQKPSPEQMETGKKLKTQLAESENQLKAIQDSYTKLIKAVPNMPIDDVPVGKSEEENVVIKTVGEPKSYDFTPKHHWELAESSGLMNKERAAKVSGSRFTYLMGGAVKLQFAIIQWVIGLLSNPTVIEQIIKDNSLNLDSKAFTPILPPALVKTEAYEATGRLNAEETTYKLADDNLWLNASAEHSLCNMYQNEIINESDLPIRFIGYATSFRREAGSYGKDTEGLIRMHQFDKLEMEVFSTAETGLDEHRLLVALEEYLVKALGLPYHVLQKCTADIGKPNAQGIDIEVWFPAQNKYRETHTADYMTDYQARSLQTRLRRSDGRIELVHTNDATAFAFPRLTAAIIENNQSSDGRIKVPEVIRPFINNQEWL